MDQNITEPQTDVVTQKDSTLQTPPVGQTNAVSGMVPANKSKKPVLRVVLTVLIVIIGVGGVIWIFTLLKSDVSLTSKRSTKSPTSTLTKTISSSAREVVIDNFNSGVLDNQRWISWFASDESTIVLEDGKVKMVIPSGFSEYAASRLELQKVINGDFEVMVDAQILSEGEDLGSEVGLVFHNEGSEWINTLYIFLRKVGSSSIEISAARLYNSDYIEMPISKIYDNTNPVTIKITRDGGIATFTYKEGDKFITLGQLTSDYFKGSGMISLHVNTFEPNYPGVTAFFDNFELKVY